MPVDFLPVPTEPEDCGSSVDVLTDGDVDLFVLDVDMESVVLPGCGPEDRIVSWISELPASDIDDLTAAGNVPAADLSVGAIDGPDENSSGNTNWT